MPKERFKPVYCRLPPDIAADLRQLSKLIKVPVAAMLRYGAAQAVAYYEEVAVELDKAQLSDGPQRKFQFK